MCEIQIEQIAGDSPDAGLITVFGSVDGCITTIDGEHLIVELSCPDQDIALFGPTDAVLGTFVEADDVFFGDDGTWFATFQDPRIAACRCGGPIVVVATCVADPACRTSRQFDELPCRTCPEVVFSDDVVPLPQPECQADGTATLELARVVSNTTGADVIAEIHPGHPQATVVPDPMDPFDLSPTTKPVPDGETLLVKATFRYPTLTHPTPYLSFTDLQSTRLACPPIPISVGPIPACCPEFSIESIVVDECQVTVRASPSPLPDGCRYVWHWDDDSGPDGDGRDVGTNIGHRVHTYARTKQAEARTIGVSVECGEEAADGSCRSPVQEEQVRLMTCTGNGGGFDWGWGLCALLLWLAVSASVGAAALAIATGCSKQPGGWPLVFGMFVSALAAWYLWIKACKGFFGCKWLCRLRLTVQVLAVVAVLFAAYHGVNGNEGCLAGFLTVAAHFGLLDDQILSKLDKDKGCNCDLVLDKGEHAIQWIVDKFKDVFS